MNHHILLKCIALSLLTFACTSNNKAPAPMPSQAYSTHYQPPVFEDANRMEKIRAAIPELEKLFVELAEKHDCPGFAYGIVADDELVLAGGLGVIDVEKQMPADSKSLFRIASMTKSFTAMAIVKLRDEGKLSLTDPVVKHLPALGSLTYLTEDAPHINILNLLTMTAGFPEDNPWADRQLEDSDEEFMQLLKDGIPFSNNPSHGYEYSNLGFAILGTIITNVAGEPYQQYINHNILEPLGMMDTKWDFSTVPDEQLALGYIKENGDWKKEPMLRDGAFGAIGGLITSIEDFGKYVSFLLSATPAHNGPETGPVKRSSVREMMRMFQPRLLPSIPDRDGNPCPAIIGYAYGLSVVQRCNGEVIVRHSGGLPGFGSNVIFLPDYGIGVFSFCNRRYGATESINLTIKDKLIELASLEARKLPVSDILAERKGQVIELMKNWDEKLGEEILANNFYLDWSREHRMKEVGSLIEKVGAIKSVGLLMPQNQLRGTFEMRGENGILRVFFSLSPEKIPKVQMLNVRLVNEES